MIIGQGGANAIQANPEMVFWSICYCFLLNHNHRGPLVKKQRMAIIIGISQTFIENRF